MHLRSGPHNVITCVSPSSLNQGLKMRSKLILRAPKKKRKKFKRWKTNCKLWRSKSREKLINLKNCRKCVKRWKQNLHQVRVKAQRIISKAKFKKQSKKHETLHKIILKRSKDKGRWHPNNNPTRQRCRKKHSRNNNCKINITIWKGRTETYVTS